MQISTTVLSQEGYANQIIREREDASDGSYNPLRRSSGGGLNKYKMVRLDFEVRHGSGFCDALEVRPKTPILGNLGRRFVSGGVAFLRYFRLFGRASRRYYSLLGVILQRFVDVVQSGAGIKTCGHPLCRREFVASRSNQLHCTDDCTQAHKQKRLRDDLRKSTAG